MNKLEALIASEYILLLDGAMGTMLMSSGLESGDSPELWNVIHPEQVRAVHRAYILAGSRMILTNSFGGTRLRLKRHGLQDRVAELNRAAASNARTEADAASHTVLVAGSMGPSGELLKPLGPLSYEEAVAAFAEQAAALAEGGVDILWVETMSDLNEVKAAVEGARQSAGLPLAATLSFDTKGRTMMGTTPAKAADALGKLDLMLIGANCGTGPEEMETIVQAMRQANPAAMLIAKANAGLPKLVGGQVVYDGSPQRMAEYAVRMRELGASLVGACCGSTPEHIRAMAEALKN
jgi:5-methyltetrahydrofolate--homocysteine methyltransferase